MKIRSLLLTALWILLGSPVFLTAVPTPELGVYDLSNGNCPAGSVLCVTENGSGLNVAFLGNVAIQTTGECTVDITTGASVSVIASGNGAVSVANLELDPLNAYLAAVYVQDMQGGGQLYRYEPSDEAQSDGFFSTPLFDPDPDQSGVRAFYPEIAYISICVYPPPTLPPPSRPPTHIGGDPHFMTWSGTKFDFHGECDLLFMHNPGFQHGIGMDIHVRTKIYRQWSYIDVATIRIGHDILEVKGGSSEVYWINGIPYDAVPTNSVGGIPMEYHRANTKQRVFNIHIDEEQIIEIRTYKDFIGINIKGASLKDFDTTVGMIGEFGSGVQLARDGLTIIHDPIAYGQEWQINADDPKLFRTVEGPQFPMELCKLPSKFQAAERQRRLGDSTVKVKLAEKACREHIHDPTDLDNCVFDVLLTDDIEVVAAH
jgi:hypothetical protein